MQNLGNYHGTGAINITQYPTWDAVLYDILYQPNTQIIVSAKRRGRGHGGWSKNNPYLKERWIEFPIDIRPASLIQRLLSVRVQLAQEFERDLDIVTMVDGMIMDSYFSKLREEEKGGISFDRISVEILSNFTEYQLGTSSSSESSTFRQGNFDLLYSLCTQAAAHRLLRELQSHTTYQMLSPIYSEHTYQWFKQFYTDNVPQYFDGDQKFGRADEFLDVLLSTSPLFVELDHGKGTGLIDPLQITERLLAIRGEITIEWKAMMNEVTEDHSSINEEVFRTMIGRTIDESGNDDTVHLEEEMAMEELSDTTGEFE